MFLVKARGDLRRYNNSQYVCIIKATTRKGQETIFLPTSARNDGEISSSLPLVSPFRRFDNSDDYISALSFREPYFCYVCLWVEWTQGTMRFAFLLVSLLARSLVFFFLLMCPVCVYTFPFVSISGSICFILK